MDASMLAFVGAAMLLVVTPGADTLLVVRNVLGRGWGAGLATTAGIAAGGGARRSFVEGALTNVLNPKVAIFYLAFLPQFVRPEDPVLARSALLAAIHVGLGVVWLSVVSLGLGSLGRFVTAECLRQRLESITGVVLVALGARLALERR